MRYFRKWKNKQILKVTALYLMWNPEICQDPPTWGQLSPLTSIFSLLWINFTSIIFLRLFKCISFRSLCGRRQVLKSCPWHQNTKQQIMFSSIFFTFFFSVWAVEKENKLFIGPKMVFCQFLANEKMVFFFNC